MSRLQVAFDLTSEVEEEAHVDTMLQIVESAMNLRLEHIANGQGQQHPVDWSSQLTEQYLRMVRTINQVGTKVPEGEEVPERYILTLINALININAVSLGFLQNLIYKDMTYGNTSDTTPSA